MSLTSVDLPEPDTPVTATRVPSGKRREMSWRLFSRAPTTVTLLPSAPAADRRARDLPAAGEVLPRDRVGVLEQALDGAGVDHLAAVLAGPRADVDDPVGRGDGVLVVLDDDERVAEVAQPGQRLDEPVVVALVQPDRGLVEDVEHADQAGADLGGQPDALGLAAGQRAGRPVQRQVVEADVEQEAQPGLDLLDDPLGDLPLAHGEVDSARNSAHRRWPARRPRRCSGRR